MAGGVLRLGKPFFSSLLSLPEEKSEHVVLKKSNYVHNKCTNCGATHSKSKFGWIRERGKFVVPKMLEQNEKESGRLRQQRQVSEGFDRGPNVNRRR